MSLSHLLEGWQITCNTVCSFLIRHCINPSCELHHSSIQPKFTSFVLWSKDMKLVNVQLSIIITEKNTRQDGEYMFWYLHKNEFQLTTCSSSQNIVSRMNYNIFIVLKLKLQLNYDNIRNSYNSRIWLTHPESLLPLVTRHTESLHVWWYS